MQSNHILFICAFHFVYPLSHPRTPYSIPALLYTALWPGSLNLRDSVSSCPLVFCCIQPMGGIWWRWQLGGKTGLGINTYCSLVLWVVIFLCAFNSCWLSTCIEISLVGLSKTLHSLLAPSAQGAIGFLLLLFPCCFSSFPCCS